MVIPPESDVRVRLDDRIRLLSALLAATSWPDRVDAGTAHGSHAHARATRKHIQPFREHAAVRVLQQLLGAGAPLDVLFTLIVRLSWPTLNSAALPRWIPPQWPDQLRDFYARAELAAFWASEASAWEKAVGEASRALNGARFRPFLENFVGPIRDALVFMPNIGYPTEGDIGVLVGRELMAIVPPPVAWGDNPPWPFDDDPAYLCRAALMQYGRLRLMPLLRANGAIVQEAAQSDFPINDAYRAQHPKWEDQFVDLALTGAVAIYLDDFVSSQEANAYVLMQRKVHGVALLPGVVSVLRRYLADQEAGKYASIIDFMPLFPKQLRVAKRIMSL